MSRLKLLTRCITTKAKTVRRMEVDPQRQSDLIHNLSQIKDRVLAAKAKQPIPRDVRLVAVSKTKPSSDILAAYAGGQRHFGENVQELVDKAQELPTDIQWHFIGSLQSNKCKILAAIPNLYAVETIDGIKKADTMQKACTSRATPLNVFVQVNTSGEESKSGIKPNECVDVAKHIVSSCPNLKLSGLMTIGSPENSSSNEENPDFKLLSECAKSVEEATGLTMELSMGMSDDFELAIQMGSTNVRVGSVLFGARAKKE
ncbi:hypothetical protein HDU76_012929 [Blyttiomyces sp. JEL0837]|nr:hypothetical protein HDU76_012929 [Blyttiomyces sp. JEL0837]